MLKTITAAILPFGVSGNCFISNHFTSHYAILFYYVRHLYSAKIFFQVNKALKQPKKCWAHTVEISGTQVMHLIAAFII